MDLWLLEETRPWLTVQLYMLSDYGYIVAGWVDMYMFVGLQLQEYLCLCGCDVCFCIYSCWSRFCMCCVFWGL